jgi:threonine dehydrogenase-like Zn-dependent dehydrogenase
MLGAVMHGPRDVRVERRNEPRIVGAAPVRPFLPDLVDLIWNRRIEPWKVFDLELPLEGAPAGYAAMDERRSIKALLRP